jgi:phosphoribosylformylglycinamidine (FGAM) synthase-like enzyme
MITEEECLQYASFENPLSFNEEEIEQMWSEHESNSIFYTRFKQMTLEVEEQ